jgi:hypothetical protein
VAHVINTAFGEFDPQAHRTWRAFEFSAGATCQIVLP